jgi:GntR family transcriptional regulator
LRKKQARNLDGIRRKHHDVSLNPIKPRNWLTSEDLPLYVQVREHLRSQIASMASGELISPEPVLCQEYRVSRITVRKAIDDLVSESLLIRKQGRGTFLAPPKLIHELNSITSWTDQLKSLNYIPHTVERSIEEMKAPKPIASMLQIGATDPVIVMRRLRLANDEPITHMVNYLPKSLVPNFREAMQDAESLYQVLGDRYSLVASRATDTVTARAATDMESERLGLEPWAPVIAVTRIAFLANGRPFEVSVAISRGDRFEYRVNLFRAQGTREGEDS